MSPQIETLAVVLRDTSWATRTVRNNTDQAVMDLYAAARAVVESEGAASIPPAPVVEPSFPTVEFHVMGVPAPQGSKTYMPKTRVMVEGSSASGRARLRSWRDAVVSAASRHVPEAGPYDGPITIEVTFRLPMPRSRPKYLQRAGEAPSTVKPDVDKLERGLLDSLKIAGLIRDDAQVWQVWKRKVEVVGWTGAHVRLWTGPGPTR